MLPTEFYHGTSLEAILAIQESGFRVDLSGTNAGEALGPGVYITTTLEKALNYAKGQAGSPNPAAGGVFQLEVNLGHCYTVRSNSLSERTEWGSQGYDSAWAAVGIIGTREENCVRDPARIRITNVVLGNTGEARRLGYVVRNGRLEAVRQISKSAASTCKAPDCANSRCSKHHCDQCGDRDSDHRARDCPKLKGAAWGTVGARVSWKSSDDDVPAGSVGEFLRFKRHSDGSFRAHVRFPGGAFAFAVDRIEPAPPSSPGGGGGGSAIVVAASTFKAPSRLSGNSSYPSSAYGERLAAVQQRAAAERESAQRRHVKRWCKKSAIVKHGAKLGEVLDDPDSDFEVKLRWADGTRSGYISATALSEASGADLSAFKAAKAKAADMAAAAASDRAAMLQAQQQEKAAAEKAAMLKAQEERRGKVVAEKAAMLQAQQQEAERAAMRAQKEQRDKAAAEKAAMLKAQEERREKAREAEQRAAAEREKAQVEAAARLAEEAAARAAAAEAARAAKEAEAERQAAERAEQERRVAEEWAILQAQHKELEKKKRAAYRAKAKAEAAVARLNHAEARPAELEPEPGGIEFPAGLSPDKVKLARTICSRKDLNSPTLEEVARALNKAVDLPDAIVLLRNRTAATPRGP